MWRRAIDCAAVPCQPSGQHHDTIAQVPAAVWLGYTILTAVVPGMVLQFANTRSTLCGGQCAFAASPEASEQRLLCGTPWAVFVLGVISAWKVDPMWKSAAELLVELRRGATEPKVGGHVSL
eukprot:4630236-Amphidinium_carterae.2